MEESAVFRHALHKTMLAAAILLGSHAAFAENRVALVIGQSAYRAVTALPNPATDAKAMSQLLGDAGFDVTSAADLSQNEMRQTVGEFAAKVAAKGPDTVALVFYAGHGLQIDGENFLVPADVDPKREADIPLQAVRLNDILNTLTSVPSKMRILLLDACRNNPFPNISTTARRGSRGRQRRRQPLYDGAAAGGQGARRFDRRHVQACQGLRKQGDGGAADALGLLVADRRFRLFRFHQCRSEADCGKTHRR